ncbi:MAG: membrane protein insertion efficiency factor YidD, partial [Pseudanabaena sp. ELA748]
MKKLLILLIQFYRIVISPLFPPRCRFQPTCSQYALTAIERFGVVKGGTMATKRILSCHPWHMG